jgi:hypothetical protein
MHAILATISRVRLEQQARITFCPNKGGEAGLARLHTMHTTGKVFLPDMDIFVLAMVLGNMREYFAENRTYTIAFSDEAAREEFLRTIGGDLESAEVESGE